MATLQSTIILKIVSAQNARVDFQQELLNTEQAGSLAGLSLNFLF